MILQQTTNSSGHEYGFHGEPPIPNPKFYHKARIVYSGFGLGTLLMPVFALFMPVPAAFASTAIVHLSGNMFKFALLGETCGQEGAAPIWFTCSIIRYEIKPINLIIAVIILSFALLELIPKARAIFQRSGCPLEGI